MLLVCVLVSVCVLLSPLFCVPLWLCFVSFYATCFFIVFVMFALLWLCLLLLFGLFAFCLFACFFLLRAAADVLCLFVVCFCVVRFVCGLL